MSSIHVLRIAYGRTDRVVSRATLFEHHACGRNAGAFFGIPESEVPSDANPDEEYWLFKAIVDMYGKPDLIGSWSTELFGFFWERDGYYIEVDAHYLPDFNYMVLGYAAYIPESAWDYYSDRYFTYILGRPALVPYDEA